jgi:hypothetical protein
MESLPGDDLVSHPSFVTNHRVTINAPPADVWPWLTQMGWHRGGWYTPRWVDRMFFPGNLPSAERLDPDLMRELRPGDTIPDGPPGTAQFVVMEARAPEVLVLHSTTHLPPGWRVRFGARLRWSWTFRLTPVGPDRTRVVLRSRGTARPRWLDLGYRLLLVPADALMGPSMLRGLKRRVEANGRPNTGRRTLPR